jgi:hypothetical protein
MPWAPSSRTYGLLLVALAACTVAPIARRDARGPTGGSSFPTLRVLAAGIDIPAVRGSSCWTEGSRSLCADAIPPPDLARGTTPPPELPPGTQVEVRFDPPPLEDTLEVHRWVEGRPVRVLLTAPGSFVLPDDPGTYVYDVSARWPRGDATWAFGVRVRSSPDRASGGSGRRP